MAVKTGRWWLCPNDPPCDHGAVLHDVEDDEDESPTCCVDGCTCGSLAGVKREDRAGLDCAVRNDPARDSTHV